MAILPQYGTDMVQNKAWYSNTVVNQGPERDNPAETFEIDPTLPSQGVQPHPQNIDIDYVVIPRGRIVSGTRRSMSATGLPKLTLADGLTNPPLGFSFENVLIPSTANRPTQFPRFLKSGYIEVPYLSAVNDSYGALYEGDYVTAYFGATNEPYDFAPEDRGKPVKWVEKALYMEKLSSASGLVTLSSATLVGIRPTVRAAYGTGSLVTPTTVWFDTVTDKWMATFPSVVSSVFYEYGQSGTQKAGIVLRMNQVSSSQEYDGWLKWVEMNYNNGFMTPMAYDYPTTAIGLDASQAYDAGSSETPIATSNTGEFTLAHGKIAPHKKIIIRVITGAVLGLDATLTNISGTNLTLGSTRYFENYTIGDYYRIDMVLGKLYLSDALRRVDATPIQAGDIRVSYNYVSRYDRGRSTLVQGGVGLRGQTDGRYTGLPGTPIHLERAAMDRRFVNAAGQFGAMRILFS